MTETLQDRLAPGAGSGIYRFGGRAGAKTLAQLAEGAGWQFLHLDASEAEDKRSFLQASARGLQFPEWAGRNWDAFEELVNDVSRLPPAPGYLVLVDGLSKFSRHAPGEMRTGLAILEQAVANRIEAGEAPLVVLVRGAGAAARHLPALTLRGPAETPKVSR